MEKLKERLGYFSKVEWTIWLSSLAVISIFFMLFDRSSYFTLAASLLGATCLMLNAKGNPLGQLLTIVFSILYGMISFSFAYYGEMITYLGMTMPMAAVALVSWLRNPYNGNRAEVRVNHIGRKEVGLMFFLTALVTVAFYFILGAFHTANLLPSTLSVTTSFIAACLTFRRSPFFAVAYACNDIILIVLWIMATMVDYSYISVVMCFVIFLVNDTYGFINWKRIERRQSAAEAEYTCRISEEY